MGTYSIYISGMVMIDADNQEEALKIVREDLDKCMTDYDVQEVFGE